MQTLLFIHLFIGLVQWVALSSGFMYGILLLLTWSSGIDFVGFLPLEIGNIILAFVLGLWIVSEFFSFMLSRKYEIEVSNTVFTPGMIIWMMIGVLEVFYRFVIVEFVSQPTYMGDVLSVFERVFWPLMFVFLVMERTLRDPQGKVKHKIFQTLALILVFVGMGAGNYWLFNNGGVYGLVREVTFQTPVRVVLDIEGGMTFNEIQRLNNFAPILYEENSRVGESRLTYIWPTNEGGETHTYAVGKNEVETRINHIRSFNEKSQTSTPSDVAIRSLNEATFTRVEVILPENSETLEKLQFVIEGVRTTDSYRASLWTNQMDELGLSTEVYGTRIDGVEILPVNYSKE